MSEIELFNIISKSGLVAILMATIYYLHSQYNSSITRFYEREKDFYKEIDKKLDEILKELKNGRRN